MRKAGLRDSPTGWPCVYPQRIYLDSEEISYFCGMNDGTIRKVIYSDEYMEYYWSLDKKARDKHNFVITVIETQYVVSEKYVKHLEGTDLYEMRVSLGNNEYRSIIFAIDAQSFIEAKSVLFLNGFRKKGTKDYKKEIPRAYNVLNKYKEAEE